MNSMIEELNKKVAYIKNKPITTHEQKSNYKSVTCTKIEAEWKKLISNKFWATGYKGALNADNKKMLVLRDRLLGFYGEEACMAPFVDQDAINIMTRGQLWYADKVNFMRGEPSQCHRNSCRLWIENKEATTICTGYALSKDGMWREHSWVIWIKPRVNRLIETTQPREAYFGYAMTQEECKQFVTDNL